MGEVVELRHHGKIVEVALNRPETYNAFDLDMVVLLSRHLTMLATEDSVSGIILTGTGRVFCAGGDLKWTVSFSERPAVSFHALASIFHLAILEIRRMEKPVVAAINGTAAGGGFSLALACDFRVMEKSAVLKQAYTSNGLSLDGGGTFTLPRIVGLARSLEMVAFDGPIPSDKALDWGLVTSVVDDGKAVEGALKMLHQMNRTSLHSFAQCKKLLTDSFNTSFESHIESERARLTECSEHPDGREGVRAFLEKRKPLFSR